MGPTNKGSFKQPSRNDSRSAVPNDTYRNSFDKIFNGRDKKRVPKFENEKPSMSFFDLEKKTIELELLVEELTTKLEEMESR
tara:strand:- start:986 stop:1231 length:246 start_codon:yes stop_codon:yes gene_type:complete